MEKCSLVSRLFLVVHMHQEQMGLGYGRWVGQREDKIEEMGEEGGRRE